MSSFKFVPILFVCFFVVLMGLIIQVVGIQILGNENLDNDSAVYINSVIGELDQNFKSSTLVEVESNLSINGTSEALDPFEKQYLESKESSDVKLPSINVLKSIPDLVLLSFGFPQETVKVFYDWLVNAIIFILAIVGFILIFGPGRAD